MSEGWKKADVPAQQFALAQKELADWRNGKEHGPFDALRDCASRISFTRPAPRILDLGCGAGYYLEVFRELWPDCWVVGMDYSAAMVEFAQQQYGSEPRTSYVQGDARDLAQFGRESFDLVFHGCCLIHIPPPQWALTLARAATITAPDGYVLAQKTPIARSIGKRIEHAAYGTRVVEYSRAWNDFARDYDAAGLVPVWEVRWNQGFDPSLVSVLFKKRGQ